MTSTRTAFLRAAESATALLRAPAVAARWPEPSALPEFTVGGLACHLANQILVTARVLATEATAGEPLTLEEYYGRSEWIGADLDAEVNVRVRRGGEEAAADGPDALLARVDEALTTIRDTLPGQPADRIAHLPWAGTALTLDDYLVTRMMEIAVHSDDLAVSVDVDTPALPVDVLDPVFALVTSIAVRRHGATAVLRALTRAERAPATIAAF